MGLKYRDMFEFPVKTFYWALSTDFEFREFPSLTNTHDHIINADNSYFIGEPTKLLFSSKPQVEADAAEDDGKGDEDEEEGQKKQAKDSDESEEEEIKVPERDLTGKFFISN